MSSLAESPSASWAPRDWIWQAPLVPPAVAATVGLLLDRYVGIPVLLNLFLLIVAGVCWLAALLCRRSFAAAFLWVAAGLAAGLHHHLYRGMYTPWDIGNYATDEPALVRIRGVLAEEPVTFRQPHNDALTTHLRPDPVYAVLEVTRLEGPDGWRTVQGRARLVVHGPTEEVHCGDTIETLGWLQAPAAPANPGEWDRRRHLLDRRIRAEIHVRKSVEPLTRVDEGWQGSALGLLAQARSWGVRALRRSLPDEQAGLASALLLGETSAFGQEGWERYVRTGVIHVLAISGQHLAILAFLLWWIFRFLGIPRHRGAWIVAVLLLAYALLTGFKPPVLRASLAVVVICTCLIFRRQMLPANTFALSWLAVIIVDPTDPFQIGCQLAFVQTATVIWGINRWLRQDDDPVKQMIALSRSRLVQTARTIGRIVLGFYTFNLVLTVTAWPLVAARQHVVTPVSIVIGPPIILLTSVSLICGFFLLSTELLGGMFSAPFAWLTRSSLTASDALVHHSDACRFGHFYVPDVPEWWLVVFYTGVLAALWIRPLGQRWRWPAFAGIAWTIVGLAAASRPNSNGELRVTFLAVGHGGCTVLETPDGRVLVYDAGAMAGPEVTRRTIAPFLWSRGHRRIDELFLSHADLDHFNGVSELAQRFNIGLVTATPTFSDKRQLGVRHTLEAMDRRRVPMRVVQAGDLLTAGDLTLQVLHPPAVGPEGNENARSMVLRVAHAGHTFLLTGDLEGPGQERVLRLPAMPVDVLMAPHHGSRTANSRDMARWAQAKLVVACQGPPRGGERRSEPYSDSGATYWSTWSHGAVTVSSSENGLQAATFRSRRDLSLPSSRRP